MKGFVLIGWVEAEIWLFQDASEGAVMVMGVFSRSVNAEVYVEGAR